ncbi:hypothetical protein, partial [Lactococcus petauri]|uniref:hypothetical protein n=1 Tax=Lactococcus petauri TaxID=1940789 RepID=UPI00254D4004
LIQIISVAFYLKIKIYLQSITWMPVIDQAILISPLQSGILFFLLVIQSHTSSYLDDINLHIYLIYLFWKYQTVHTTMFTPNNQLNAV